MDIIFGDPASPSSIKKSIESYTTAKQGGNEGHISWQKGLRTFMFSKNICDVPRFPYARCTSLF
jgi:hypothetical protein